MNRFVRSAWYGLLNTCFVEWIRPAETENRKLDRGPGMPQTALFWTRPVLFLTKPIFLAAVLSASSCAHDTSLQGRLSGADESAKQAEAALKEGDQRLRAGDLSRAESLLAEARARVDDPQMVYYADRENLEDRLKQVEARFEKARDVKQRQEVATQIVGKREKLDKNFAELRAAVDTLKKREELTRKQIKVSRSAAQIVEEALEDNKTLESNADYASHASNLRKQLAQLMGHINLAEALVTFAEGPGARAEEAKALIQKSKAEKDEKTRIELLNSAREKFTACAKEGGGLIAQTPPMSGEPFFVNGQKTSPKVFVAECEGLAKSSDGTASIAKPVAQPEPEKSPTKTTKKKKKKKAKKEN